jgi:predicted Zn-dependent protease
MRQIFCLCTAWLLIAGSASAADKGPDLGFLQRLQANEVEFTAQPLASAATPLYSADLPEVVDDPAMQAEAEYLIARLLNAHPGPKPAHITFLIAASDDFNCSTQLTGEIVCTYAVLDRLLNDTGGPLGEQELAFLLAHELGHRLIAGHGARFAKSDKVKDQFRQTGEMVAIALDIALSKRVGNTVESTPAGTSALFNGYFGGIYAGDAASGLASMAWSQKEEDEADQYAVFLMQRAGYDVSIATQLFAALDNMVKTNQLKHKGSAEVIADRALAAAAMQALVKNTNVIDLVGGAFLGGLSAMDQIAADHYHRDFGDRAKRCASMVAQLDPDTADQRSLAFAEFREDTGATPPSQVASAALLSTPSSLPRTGRGRVTRVAKKSVAPAAPPPPSRLELAQVEGAATFPEIATSRQVLQTLATKGDKEALKLCPSRPRTDQLAVSCGVALASDNQKAAANALFDRALADKAASPRMFRIVALTRAQLKDEPGALHALDLGDARYPGGEFEPDRIAILLQAGDKDGAKAAADRCQKEGSTATKSACMRVMLTAKA